MRDTRYSRRALLVCAPVTALAALAACSSSPTATPARLSITTPTAVISTITVVVRSGSAVIPSPIGQSASSVAMMPATSASPAAPAAPALPMGTVVIAPTVPVPALRTGSPLVPLTGGTPFTTNDGKATLRYPTDWDVQKSNEAAQFAPRNAMPTDANVPRVNFIGQAVQIDVFSGDNAAYYTQSIASATRDRGADDLIVRSVERVMLGGANGPPALKIVVAYTAAVPVVSEQIIVQAPNSDRTYFISATAPASDYDAKWRGIIDGMAGSLTFQ